MKNISIKKVISWLHHFRRK